jgi:hypothetical protein|tara:strand:+ start:618 stop:806 length:189 start_codon:yes stop_codon:yes gene_type:complete
MTNHRETRYGKGDFRRPENGDKFSKNFDAIFGKQDETARVQNQSNAEWLAEYEEALRENDLS